MISFRRAALLLAFLAAHLCVLVAFGIAPATAGIAPRWLAPLPAPLRVVHGFEPPAHRWLAGHRGVDLAGRVGDPVRAAGGGVVSVAGPVAGVLVVAVRHPDGLETTYEPVRAAVRRGQRVRPGQVLGTLVLAGGHCRPAACLHWGLRRGDAYLDPLGLVGPARVRLLPLGSSPPRWAAPLAGTPRPGPCSPGPRSSAVRHAGGGAHRRPESRRSPRCGPGVHTDLGQPRTR